MVSLSFLRATHDGPRETSEQIAERPEVEVQVAVLEAELALELLHPTLELHERLAEPLDLLVGERALLHPTQRLPFHQLPEELDQRQHLLHALGICVDSLGEGRADAVELRGELLEVGRAVEDLVVPRRHAASAV